MAWAENKIIKRRNRIREKNLQEILSRHNNQKAHYRCKSAFVEGAIESDIRYFSNFKEGMTAKDGMTQFRVSNDFDYPKLKKVLRKNREILLKRQIMEAKNR